MMSPTRLFERLGAPLRNSRWSWGAVRPADGAVFLRVWKDRTTERDGRRYILVTHRRKHEDTRDHGYSERGRHVAMIQGGAPCFLVVYEAVTADASPRQIAKDVPPAFFRGGEVIELGGEQWIELVKPRTFEELANSTGAAVNGEAQGAGDDSEIDITIEDAAGHVVTDWRAWSRPKREYQWRAGRSAMELARAWFTSPVPLCPAEIDALLASHALTEGVHVVEGRAEAVTPLPERGEGRNHDLLLLARGRNGDVVVAVEAKVDEPFGDLVGDYWAEASRRSGSRAPARIETLLALVFGPDARPTAEPWSALRYQLLTACAGALLEARKAQAAVAVVAIHEFRTESANADALRSNHADFARFVSALTGAARETVNEGMLYGAVKHGGMAGNEPAVSLLLGKAVYDWSEVPGGE